MTDWRKFVEEKDWQALEGWLGDNAFCCSDVDETVRREALGEAAKVLAWLQANVPMVTEQNGIEIRKRHMDPEDAPDEWQGAAKILDVGELEALVAEEPPKDMDTWNALLEDIRVELDDITEADEVTEGDAALSRKGHALAALEFLEQAELSEAAARGGLDEAERAWLREVVSGVASNAFRAGQHYEAVRKKTFEDLAKKKMASNETNQRSAPKGGAAQSAKKAKRYQVLNRLASEAERKFHFATPREAVRIAKKLVVEHDRGSDEPLFLIDGKLLSEKWFSAWYDVFRTEQKIKLNKQ